MCAIILVSLMLAGLVAGLCLAKYEGAFQAEPEFIDVSPLTTGMSLLNWALDNAPDGSRLRDEAGRFAGAKALEPVYWPEWCINYSQCATMAQAKCVEIATVPQAKCGIMPQFECANVAQPELAGLPCPAQAQAEWAAEFEPICALEPSCEGIISGEIERPEWQARSEPGYERETITVGFPSPEEIGAKSYTLAVGAHASRRGLTWDEAVAERELLRN